MRESKIVLYLERKPLVFITCHIAYNKCNQMFWQPRGHSTKKKKKPQPSIKKCITGSQNTKTQPKVVFCFDFFMNSFVVRVFLHL